MVFLNYTTMQMTAKIVYYGPGLCGKTTNLQFIHQKTAPKSRGEMVSLETETDRTLFFDLLPLDVGIIGGMKVRLQLYTVPGQVFYNATRKLVLKGVDGIVFVADSQMSMFESNIESLKNLATNFDELGIVVDEIPIIYQYNKRDIRSIHTVEKLDEILNPKRAPYFEAAALHGIGVFETLKCISRLALASVRKKVLSDAPRKAPVAPGIGADQASRPEASAARSAPGPLASQAASGVAAPPSVRPAPSAPSPAARTATPTADPLADLVADTPLSEEIPVEFAEEDIDKHLRAVQTKAQVDIQEELEKLRTITTSSSSKAAAPTSGTSKDVERRLQDMLGADRDPRQEIRRKASLEVPARLLKGASEMKIHLGFEGPGGEETVHDAVTVKLFGNKRLERLTLHIDLELKGKG